MRLFSKKNKAQYAAVQTAHSGSYSAHPFSILNRQTAVAEREMYKALREAVPIIDAAICKIVRLVGEFELYSDDKKHCVFHHKVLEIADGEASHIRRSKPHTAKHHGHRKHRWF